jgi:hypothetical protein
MVDLIIDIKNKIHNIREKQVMLDFDLAELYGVSTKRLNEQVKRNIERFPEDFMFQLNDREKMNLVAICDHISNLKYSYNLPFVFTEQGVSMLSGILRSRKAVEVNIRIMRAFVEMRRFFHQNFGVFEKLQMIDKKLLVHDDNFNKIFKAMEQKHLMPTQGIFFDGKVFDAFMFVSSLIKKAKTRIVLVDNYVDENTLKLFSDKSAGVHVKIYTNDLSDKLLLALNKFNEQFGGLEIFEFKKSHDRFLIIDDGLYHFGASLKDLGKKWFAFSLMKMSLDVVLSKLE